MKLLNLRLPALFAGLLFTLATTSHAGSLDVQATAVIQPPLKVETLESLAFGTIAPDTLSSGSVTVNPYNDNSSTCAANISCIEGGDRAILRVSGLSAQAIEVSTTNSVTLSNSNGDTMQVDNFTLAGTGYSNGIGYIQNDGTLELGIGAQLNIAADQATGNYSGIFRVTMAYQ